MFSCEFCEISENTFFIEHLWATASLLGLKVTELLSKKSDILHYLGPCQRNIMELFEEFSVGKKLHHRSRSSRPEVFCEKKVFLDISQNSQGKACARVFFLIKLQVSVCNLLKKRLCYRCFSLNFSKFLRTPSLTDDLRRLLHRCLEGSWTGLCFLLKSSRLIVLLLLIKRFRFWGKKYVHSKMK